MLQSICGFIFDLDGTLVSSSLNFKTIKQELDCPPDQDILEYVESLPSTDKHKATKLIEQYELEDARNAQLIPGAREFLTYLVEMKVPTAIVTRNSTEAAQIKVNNTKLPVTQIITRHDAAPKPNPESLVLLAKQWQIRSENLAYIGDYIYDIQAARRANMKALLYYSDSEPDYAHQADLSFSCWHHLLKQLPNSRGLQPESV
ncbi:HAD family hydrolase [Pleionea sediminis]|uniref:HAD family hydrolase n=1 Tax=Pleionea sediminis TaxID=2569479 RepID=UPI001186CFB2|nr:HAD family hydrolase [Pleionea sediminis]